MDYYSILSKLNKSKFRSSFKLNEKDIGEIRKEDYGKIKYEIKEIFEKRIKVKLENDGKQTPFGKYFVFKAQHATATCCRKCIEKWHKIPENKILDEIEMNYLTGLVEEWIRKQLQ
ncbi:MAG: DUF4186 family protein [Candidatus Pacearchaeota archaeon]